MKHVIYSDVDGTIYPKSKEIHPHNIEAIKFAQKNNVEFVIATGNGAFDQMKHLGKQLNVRYLITSNGASIFDLQLNDFIFKSFIPTEKVLLLAKKAFEINAPSSTWDDKHFYTTTKDEALIKLIQNVMMADAPLKTLNDVNGPAFKFETYASKEQVDQIEKLAISLDLQVVRMRDEHIEITHVGVNKGNGIKVLNELLGIEHGNFMSIGDSPNDHSMLQLSDFSYAMANADEETKSKSKFHTSSVEQGGLGEAIEDFIYRKKIAW